MILQSLILLAFGLALLVKGADWFVEGASMIARRSGISELVIGLTIVAMGTSLPEAAVSIAAALENNSGVAIGNVVGSNIANILLILGLTSIIASVSVKRATVTVELPFLIFVSVLLLISGRTDNIISGLEGAVFCALFIIYLGYLYSMSRRDEAGPAEDAHPMDRPVWQCAAILVLTGIMIIKGSEFAVSGAKDIAAYVGLSDRVIGLTIVAVGTSLPELVTCLAAALKGKADLAIGNIVGSNIFNILFILGTASIITPVPFEPDFIIDMAVCILAAVMLWAGVLKRRSLTRPVGILMLAVYAGYIAYLIADI
ncbi:MAG: calcium/sodium antiporter [Firmicutes bacterium]|nr:calcium/sodium antiporter [Bacillota bacterium]